MKNKVQKYKQNEQSVDPSVIAPPPPQIVV